MMEHRQDNSSLLKAIDLLLDDLTKPKGSLGKLEDYARKLAVIQGKVPPQIRKKAVFVIAGDHGISDEGVSLYPSEVTAQMMHNFMAGGAGINVISRHCGFDVFAVDAGIKGSLPDWPALDPEKAFKPDASTDSGGKPYFFNMKVLPGSANFRKAPALTPKEFDACMQNGKKLAAFAIASGYDMVAIGDMGIGNTTSAAAILAALGLRTSAVVDRGTGIDKAMLKKKHRLIKEALKKHGPFGSGAESALLAGQAFAGPELATMAGLCLGLAGSRTAIMLDGFPVSSAACLAYRINPEVKNNYFAGHLSRVKGHKHSLAMLGLNPVLSLEMRLGEGTGAVLGGSIVELAAKICNEMARFSDMQVSKAVTEEEDY